MKSSHGSFLSSLYNGVMTSSHGSFLSSLYKGVMTSSRGFFLSSLYKGVMTSSHGSFLSSLYMGVVVVVVMTRALHGITHLKTMCLFSVTLSYEFFFYEDFIWW